MALVKEEWWSVPVSRAEAFFRSFPNAVPCQDGFRIDGCLVTLTSQAPGNRYPWITQGVRIRLEGEQERVDAIYHQFFLQFLSAGG